MHGPTSSPAAHWFWPAITVLLSLSAALALGYRYLPLVDWPQQCALASIASHWSDPLYRFRDYYQPTTGLLPYQTFRFLQVGLGRLVGDDFGFRAALLVYLVGAPLAAAGLAKRFGRDRIVGLATFVVLIEGNLLWGFAPYQTAITFFLVGLLLVIDALASGAAWRFVALALLGVVLFFTHAIATAIWISATVLIAFSAWRLRRTTQTCAALTALTTLPATILLGVFLLAGGWVSGAALEGEFAIDGGAYWEGPLAAASLWGRATGLLLTGRVPMALFVVVLGALALGAGWQRLATSRRTSAPFAFVAPLGLVLFLSYYFALPAVWRGEAISTRVASLTALWLLWLFPLRPPESSREARVLLPVRLLVLFGALGSLLWAHLRFAEYRQALAPLDRLLERIPRGSRVATLAYQLVPDGFVYLPAYVHLGGYVQAARGGMASFCFVRTGVTYLPAVPRPLLLINDPWMPSRGGQLPSGAADYYDFVLVRVGSIYPGSPIARGSSGAVPAIRIFAEGGLELWQTRRFLTGGAR